jgi:hypothetical protein
MKNENRGLVVKTDAVGLPYRPNNNNERNAETGQQTSLQQMASFFSSLSGFSQAFS